MTIEEEISHYGEPIPEKYRSYVGHPQPSLSKKDKEHAAVVLDFFAGKYRDVDQGEQ